MNLGQNRRKGEELTKDGGASQNTTQSTAGIQHKRGAPNLRIRQQRQPKDTRLVGRADGNNRRTT